MGFRKRAVEILARVLVALWVLSPLWGVATVFLCPTHQTFYFVFGILVVLSIATIILLYKLHSGGLTGATPEYYGCHCYE